MKFTHQWLTDLTPMYPSQRAHDEARTLFKRIPYSALRMLAQLILERTKRTMPTDDQPAPITSCRYGAVTSRASR